MSKIPTVSASVTPLPERVPSDVTYFVAGRCNGVWNLDTDNEWVVRDAAVDRAGILAFSNRWTNLCIVEIRLGPQAPDPDAVTPEELAYLRKVERLARQIARCPRNLSLEAYAELLATLKEGPR